MKIRAATAITPPPIANAVRQATRNRADSRAPIRFPTRTLALIAIPSGSMNVKLAMLITT